MSEISRQEIEAAAEQLELEPRARARNTDPSTSHEAAASVKEIRVSQAAVLACLRLFGPMHDQLLVSRYLEQQGRGRSWPQQSESGIRTRRSELTALGLVHGLEERVRLPSGRRSIVWEAQVSGDVRVTGSDA